MPREYGFAERLQMSQGISETKDIADILMKNIPGATSVMKSVEQDDRNGTDYWVKHTRGEPYSVDVKVRGEDWAFKPAPNTADDLALEVWSVVEREIVGWTRNPNKMTDYVLWYWSDSGRWCMVPFIMLCTVFQEHLDTWVSQYRRAKQKTPRRDGTAYHSECVFVPRREVWAAIYNRFGGSAWG